MRNLFLLICLFIILETQTFLVAQQSSISGIVAIWNSGYDNNDKVIYVQNAQIEDFGSKAHATTTDAKGGFKLVYVGVNEKESVELFVRKEGLGVVNQEGLKGVLGQYQPLRIYMAKPNYIADFKRKIYKIGKTFAEEALEMQLNKNKNMLNSLKSQTSYDKKKIELLEKMNEDLETQKQSIDKYAKILADQYAAINLDDVEPFLKDAFDYFQKGDLDSALVIFDRNKEKLEKEGKDILYDRHKTLAIESELNERKRINKERTLKMMQIYSLEANTYILKLKFNEADFAFNSMLKLDSINPVVYRDYGNFLVSLNKIDNAISIYQKGLTYAQKPETLAERIELMNNLGETHRKMKNYDIAEGLLLQASQLAVQNRIANKYPFDSLWAGAQLYLGNVYYEKNMFNKADTVYTNAFKIVEEKTSNLNATEHDSLVLVDILKNLAVNYRNQKNYINSARCFERGLAIYDNILKSNPFHKRSLAELKNSYGNFLYDIDSLTQAIAALKDAVSYYNDLMQLNKSAFENLYLQANYNLGRTYLRSKKYNEALPILLETIKIQKVLADSQPVRHGKNLITMLNTLGAVYNGLNNDVASDSIFDVIIKKQNYFLEKTKLYNEADICKTYFNRALLYQKKKNWISAEIWYLNAASGRRKWANESPEVYGENHIITLQCLINIYDSMRLTEHDEKQIKQLDIYQNSFRNEMLTLQIKIVNAYEKATVNGKHAKLNAAYETLASCYLSLKKYKEAEIAAKKQEPNAAYFLVFIYAIQDNFKEVRLVLEKITYKKEAKSHCLELADDFFNQKIISEITRTKIYKWFETLTDR